MKPSQYNFFFDGDDGKKLAFNAFTTALAVLSQDEYEIAQKILKKSNDFKFNSKKRRDLRDNLKKGGFIIEDEDDEFAFLKLRNRIGRFNTSSFGLTIVPTLNCNFNCSYCYEGEKKKINMNEKVEKALVKLVRERTKNVKRFGVTWYGGEPTLKIEQIVRLSKKFKEICKKNGCSYSAGMVSNGYLLNRDMAKKLKRMSVKKVQITIDGPKDIHDKKRPLKNGNGTFDRIIENIRNIYDVLKVSVRINTDNTNKDRVFELFEFIKKIGLKDKITINIAPILEYTEMSEKVAKECFLIPEFSEFEVNFRQKLKKNGLIKSYRSYFPNHYSGPTCTADCFNSYVVTPSGNLFKCWTEVNFSEDFSVGNLLNKNPSPYQRENWEKWLLWDPFENQDCIKCKFLPICNGGCPYWGNKMIEENKGSYKCVKWKYNLEKVIKFAYLQFSEEKKGGATGDILNIKQG
jgi:uncharacterized protein